jgi:hypothetical protein
LNRFRHPEGARLPALERNILKYRAFEMVLVLFYAEYLKDVLIGSIQASDRFKKGGPRINSETKNKFKVATATLVADGILTKEENEELTKLVNFRNEIAHSIHDLTFDVSRGTYARGALEVSEMKYDYGALKRIRVYYDEILNRMHKARGYVFMLSMNRLLFESAEPSRRWLQASKKSRQMLHRRLVSLSRLGGTATGVESRIVDECASVSECGAWQPKHRDGGAGQAPKPRSGGLLAQ